MPNMDLPLVYRYRPGQSEAPIVLMVHGYGSHENDLFGLADFLPSHLHLLSVRAPIPLDYGGFAWYQIDFQNIGGKINNIPQAKEALATLRNFVSQARKALRLVDNPLWLMGFSQGCILSYAYALSYPAETSKVMALNGYLLKELVPNAYQLPALKHLDFFVSHGVKDPIIPIQAARQSTTFLEKLGIGHQYREYPEGHGLNAENLKDLQNWVKARV